MKKMMLVSICLVALISCGDIDIRTDSPIVEAGEGEIEKVLFLGADSNRGPCPSIGGIAFTRSAPGVCSANPQYGLGVNFRGATCAEVTPVGLPSNAKAVVFVAEVYVESQNAVGFRETSMNFRSDSGCSASILTTVAAGASEEVAKAAGTIIGRVMVPTGPIPVTNGKVYASCNQLVTNYCYTYVQAYYD